MLLQRCTITLYTFCPANNPLKLVFRSEIYYIDGLVRIWLRIGLLMPCKCINNIFYCSIVAVPPCQKLLEYQEKAIFECLNSYQILTKVAVKTDP